MAGEFNMDEFMRQFANQSAGAQQEDTLAQIKKLLPFILGEFEKSTEILDQLIENVGPKVYDYLDDLRRVGVKMDINTIEQYKRAGLSQEEAIGLLVVRKQTASSVLKNINFQK